MKTAEISSDWTAVVVKLCAQDGRGVRFTSYLFYASELTTQPLVDLVVGGIDGLFSNAVDF